MKILIQLKQSWAAIRWKMLLLSSFFSIISVVMVTCLSIAVINVLIRRESAYLIEERIKVIVESPKGLVDPLLERAQSCEEASDSTLYAMFTEHLNAEWPGSESIVRVLSTEDTDGVNPQWLSAPSFAGVVEDQAALKFASWARQNAMFVL